VNANQMTERGALAVLRLMDLADPVPGKHDGSLPIIGVDTFLGSAVDDEPTAGLELARATETETSRRHWTNRQPTTASSAHAVACPER
jgi:methylmalonyl-CoA mutase